MSSNAATGDMIANICSEGGVLNSGVALQCIFSVVAENSTNLLAISPHLAKKKPCLRSVFMLCRKSVAITDAWARLCASLLG